MQSISIYVWIALGGSLGACFRHAITQGSLLLFSAYFPLGTLIANTIGCLFIGSLYGWLNHNELVAEDILRPLVGIGFCGALTTFSAFSMDNFLLLEQGHLFKAMFNIFLNITLCLGAIMLGYLGFSLLHK